MVPRKTLVFIPTYNEAGNAPVMCQELDGLGLDCDVLFVDDNSPDGTGQILEGLKSVYPRLIVQHRAGKLGIGSAHFEAIAWAYDQGYQLLVTMDGDFSHTPSDIPAMIRAAEHSDVAVGSRWVRPNSLPGWNLFRRCATVGGHVLTKFVLGVPQDASGAFRAYRLDRLPREVFRPIRSRDYAFFFESLFIIHRNGFTIAEVPIALPARTYGNSKMTMVAALKSGGYVFELFFASLRSPKYFMIEKSTAMKTDSMRRDQHR